MRHTAPGPSRLACLLRPQELRQALNNVLPTTFSTAEVKDLLKQFDADGNGKLDLTGARPGLYLRAARATRSPCRRAQSSSGSA